MKTAQLNGKTIGFLEVPSEASSFRISYQGEELVFKSDDTFKRIRIEKGNWRIVALSTEVTEEMAREVMPGLSVAQLYGVWYSIGNGERYCHETALEAFNSLKVSLGVVDVNPMPKPKESDLDSSFFEMQVDLRELEQWQEAQQQLKTYLIIIKEN
jgi:hypothetical protein